MSPKIKAWEKGSGAGNLIGVWILRSRNRGLEIVKEGRREGQFMDASLSWPPDNWGFITLGFHPWGVWRPHLRIGCSRDREGNIYAPAHVPHWSKFPSLSLKVSGFQGCASTTIAEWVTTSPTRWQLRSCKVADTQCSLVRFSRVIPAPAGCCSNSWN